MVLEDLGPEHVSLSHTLAAVMSNHSTRASFTCNDD